MIDDEEMEEFEMNEEDLRRAFDPTSNRRKKQTKEDAMLGIFAASDSEEEEEADERFDYRKQKKSKSSMNFISAGIAGSKKESPTNDDENEDENDDNENYTSDENDPSMGFDVKKAKPKKTPETISEPNLNEEVTSKNKFENNNLKKFASNLKQQREQAASTSQTKGTNQFKGKQTEQFISKSAQKDIGNWEKHTKGFGLKMLTKMGWEKGKGLGKEGQGRAIPVEAFVRKGKAAVGMYGAESKDVLERNFRKYKQGEEEEEEEENDVHVSQWKKDKKASKRPQYAHRTPQELLELAANNPQKLKRAEQMLDFPSESRKELSSAIAATKIKVIDMTGKEQRVMHGYESLSMLTRQKETLGSGIERKNFDLPELAYNLELLVNLTEDQILQSDRKLKHNEDMIVSLSYEEKRSREKVRVEQEQIDKIKNLLGVIDKCEQLVKEDNVTLNDLIDIFQDLQTNYADEFLIFNLSQVAIPLLVPLLNKRMSRWNPFDEENKAIMEISTETDEKFDLTNNNLYYAHEIYTDLKELLNERTYDSSFKSGLKISSYDRIIWETWMPAFRRLMSNQSIKKCSHKCTDLLNAWQSLVPPWILRNILDQIILPKLITETEEWNPTMDTIPIHVWIHPWLPFMKERLDTEIFPTIRFKLANALSNWHPSDKSAYAILKPWKPPVFTIGSWDAFVCKNILPKLQLVLAEGEQFLIEPTEQNLEAWYWVMDWQELLPFNSFVALIENFFFPKWLQVLSVWLNSSPNYEEVSKWYMGWKNLIPDKLLQHPNIKTKLSHGLIMMNRSVGGAQVSLNDTYPTNAVPQQESTSKPANVGVQLTSNPSISSFKDIIQKKAADNNLLFMPVLNRFKEGKQVYRFGNLNIYIDRNVVFMLENGNFRPASVKEILEKSL